VDNVPAQKDYISSIFSSVSDVDGGNHTSALSLNSSLMNVQGRILTNLYLYQIFYKIVSLQLWGIYYE
jgi:hypothetical protein